MKNLEKGAGTSSRSLPKQSRAFVRFFTKKNSSIAAMRPRQIRSFQSPINNVTQYEQASTNQAMISSARRLKRTVLAARLSCALRRTPHRTDKSRPAVTAYPSCADDPHAHPQIQRQPPHRPHSVPLREHSLLWPIPRQTRRKHACCLSRRFERGQHPLCTMPICS